MWDKAPTSDASEGGDGERPISRFSDPMDLLRALPDSIVHEHIYQFAVLIIKDRDQLIEAVDRYFENGFFRYQFPIRIWDVQRVTDFHETFDVERNPKRKYCDVDVSSWNVSNGATFYLMFFRCRSFNSDVSSWNVGNATNFSEMFANCNSFSSDVSGWNVVNATIFSAMFYQCGSFNSDVSGWNVENATVFSHKFAECNSFNSDVSGWNVANARILRCMFADCYSFNSDVSGWNLANATTFGCPSSGDSFCKRCCTFPLVASFEDFPGNLRCMFAGCISFNRDSVSGWPVDAENILRLLF